MRPYLATLTLSTLKTLTLQLPHFLSVDVYLFQSITLLCGTSLSFPILCPLKAHLGAQQARHKGCPLHRYATGCGVAMFGFGKEIVI